MALTTPTHCDLPASPEHAVRRITTAQEAADYIREKQIQHIKIGITDINGVMRGKYVSTKKFIPALEKGLGFCDVIAGVDIDDQLVDNLHNTGWHSGYPDAPIHILPDTCRHIPFEPNTLLFLAQFDQSHQALCPRQTLMRVLHKAQELGYQPICAMEFEFSVFQNTIQQLHDSAFSNPTPFTPANCGYSLLRSNTYAEFYQALLQLCDHMDMPIEGLHTEIGPGVLEAAIGYDHALHAADKAALFKTFAKTLAQRQQLTATFMAKWHRDHQGQSGHTHISLQDQNNRNVFFADHQPHHISDTMRHFIAGQQRLMPELLALLAPSVNSFARLVPGYWAPTQASWGIDNRTCALRAITGSSTAQRVEYRVPGADVNPYFAIAAALASGLYGIENQLQPIAPIEGNAYEIQLPKAYQLPRNLHAAAQRLRQSTMAREYFGDAFVDDIATVREHEQREANRQVTQWQLQRYFELA